MTKSLLLSCGLAAVVLTACQTIPENFELKTVKAKAETADMVGQGDRADDPAIWVHPGDVAQSLILGTNKDEGLHVYALDGEELEFLDVGQLNNVDLRGNIAAASNDEVGAISWFSIDAGSRAVTHLGDTPIAKNEPYGFCLGTYDGAYLAGVTYKDGTVQLWQSADPASTVEAELVRTVKLKSKLEGCVFDEENGTLFIGEEAFGIWALDYADDASEPVVVDRIKDGNGLVEDTEGLSIWRGANGQGYLVASAQAADRYVVYSRTAPYAPLGVFSVSESVDGSVDAVSHTDGLDVTSTALPDYPRGLLVVQDDANPVSEINQNFKLIDWADVEAALNLPH